MDELKLSDLEFGDSNDVFDVFASTEPKSKEDVVIKNPADEIKKNAVGEGIKDPEIVAKGEENKDKEIQDGKKAPASNGEGGNSSSPTMPNDTEKLYSTLAAEFKAKGVLANLDLDKEKITSMEDINKALEREIESRLTGRQRKIDEAINAGVPAKEIDKQLKSVESLKGISQDFVSDPENSDFRKNVIAQDFINKGYNKEKAIVLAQRSIDAGEDVQDAIDSLNEIISLEESKIDKLITGEREKESKAINDIKELIQEKEEILPGIKLTIEQKEALYNSVITDKGNKENAFMKAQQEDPLGSRMKLEALFFITKGFTDFSAFGKSQETKISNSIESLLRGTSFTSDGRVNTETKDSMSSFTLKDLKGIEFE